MICWSVKRRSADYVDGRLRASEHSRIEAHLLECEACAVKIDELRSVRSSLRDLRKPAVPTRLKLNLRIIASQERQAIIETHGSRFRRIWNQWKFRINEMMRPLTIPATGGLLSSFALFSALAFTVGTRTGVASYEVPILFAEHIDANLVPLQLRSSVVLTLSLDTHGHITDYAVRDGSASFVGDAARLQDNAISLPEFPSVLAVAQPVSSDIRISFTPIVFRP